MIAQNLVLFFVHYFRKGCDGLFKKNFERLCNVRGKSPTTVCVELGLSHSVYSLWTDSTVPRRATLQKIADYFGVTPEELLQDEPTKKEKTPEPLDPDHNVLIMRGRDGSYIRKQLTDEEVRALAVLVSQMKDAPDDI